MANGIEERFGGLSVAPAGQGDLRMLEQAAPMPDFGQSNWIDPSGRRAIRKMPHAQDYIKKEALQRQQTKQQLMIMMMELKKARDLESFKQALKGESMDFIEQLEDDAAKKVYEAYKKGGPEAAAEVSKQFKGLLGNIHDIAASKKQSESKAEKTGGIKGESENITDVGEIAETKAKGKRSGEIKAEDDLLATLKRVKDALADLDTKQAQAAADASKYEAVSKEKGSFIDTSETKLRQAYADSAGEDPGPLVNYAAWYKRRREQLNKRLPEGEKLRDIQIMSPEGNSWVPFRHGPDQFPILVYADTKQPLGGQEAILKKLGATPAQVKPNTGTELPTPTSKGIKWLRGGPGES